MGAIQARALPGPQSRSIHIHPVTYAGMVAAFFFLPLSLSSRHFYLHLLPPVLSFPSYGIAASWLPSLECFLTALQILQLGSEAE